MEFALNLPLLLQKGIIASEAMSMIITNVNMDHLYPTMIILLNMPATLVSSSNWIISQAGKQVAYALLQLLIM